VNSASPAATRSVIPSSFAHRLISVFANVERAAPVVRNSVPVGEQVGDLAALGALLLDPELAGDG